MIFSFSSFLNSLSEKFCACRVLMKVARSPPKFSRMMSLHPLLDEIIRQLEFFLLERLHDQLPIDQILQRSFAGLLDLLLQLLAFELRAQEPFARRGEPRTCE